MADVADVAEQRSSTAVLDGMDAFARGGTRSGKSGVSARWAAWTFAAVIAIAVPVILHQGRDQWFFLDDWDFLALRSAGSFHDLMAPHVQHWTTFGVLVYRALWSLVGLRHYWPYLLVLVTLHLAAVVLLRAVMRRAGVHPWVATAAASLFAFFGAGRGDIIVAFQITLTGALTFGLAHMLLADHDGRFDRRDAIGVGFGVVALMCSAVGVMMAVAVAIAVLLRRGWRMAVAHTAPLAAIFLLWSATYGRDSYGGQKASAGSVVSFLRESLAYAFDGLGQVRGAGVVLALVVLVGLPLALRRQTWDEFRRFAGPTAGLAVAALGFVLTTGYARAIGVFSVPVLASASRYIYLTTALLLPTIALAASAIVDRWRLALAPVLALFLVGLPANVAALHASGAEAAMLGDPDLVLTMARLPLARDVPRDLNPLKTPEASFPIGWLVDGVASGRVPPAGAASPQTVASAELLLSVYQTTDPPTGVCVPIPPRTPVEVRQGDAIEISGPVIVARRIEGSSPVLASFPVFPGRTLRIVGGPLELVVRPTSPDEPVELCR